MTDKEIKKFIVEYREPIKWVHKLKIVNIIIDNTLEQEDYLKVNYTIKLNFKNPLTYIIILTELIRNIFVSLGECVEIIASNFYDYIDEIQEFIVGEKHHTTVLK